ncbi:MAG: HAMP domain-containing histidine kinase [Lachnospiraceae bacterium]|nr:HAMP domain-containing histidine kinase [Lachnospiraceae bacterium]
MKKYYRRLMILLCGLMTLITIVMMIMIVTLEVDDVNEEIMKELKRDSVPGYSPDTSAAELLELRNGRLTEEDALAIAQLGYCYNAVTDLKDVDGVGCYIALVDRNGKVYDMPRNFLKMTGTESQYGIPRKENVTFFLVVGEELLAEMDQSEIQGTPIEVGREMMLNGAHVSAIGLLQNGIGYVQILEVGRIKDADGEVYEVKGFDANAPDGWPFIVIDDTYPHSYLFQYQYPYNYSFHAEAEAYTNTYSRTMSNHEKERRNDEARDAFLDYIAANNDIAGYKPFIDPDTADIGFFTSRLYRRGKPVDQKFEEAVPEYLAVYVYHPFAIAWEHLRRGLYSVAAVWLVSIGLICLLVNLLYKRQENYEMSRFSMTKAVAHELKTPFAVTKNYAENWDYFDEEQQKNCRADMLNQIEYMDRILGSLLELSRMESNAKKANPEPVNLVELNEVVLRQLKPVTGDKTIMIHGAENPDPFTVDADLGMMRTVLTNFVSNAIRYGGSRIDISFIKKRRGVRYEITNDGTPIPKEKIKYIWDEFYRVDDARSKDAMFDRPGSAPKEGTGLGLAITRRILKLHHAKYGCTSGEEGTTFFFELPDREG